MTAAALAGELGVSERTIYRDIATLAGQGVPVADETAVRALHGARSARGVHILQPPMAMEFGVTFVAADPDGHRLRVFAPAAS